MVFFNTDLIGLPIFLVVDLVFFGELVLEGECQGADGHLELLEVFGLEEVRETLHDPWVRERFNGLHPGLWIPYKAFLGR